MEKQQIDNKQQNEVVANAVKAANLQAQAVLPPETILPAAAMGLQATVTAEKKPEEEMSPGEKRFNTLVYSGLNYWANLGFSLVVADYFRNLSGKHYLEKMINNTGKALEATKMVSHGGAHKFGKTMWETMAMTSGGWLAAFATKPLEDNKRQIVHWLNKKMGVDQTAPDGHEKTPEQIHIEEDIPPQSWFNVIKRRIYASIAIVSTGFAIEHTVGQARLQKFVVDTTNKGLKSGLVPGGAALAKENGIFQRYLGFAALDTIFTGSHALTMQFTNGGRQVKMPKEIDNSNDPPGKETLDEIIVLPMPEKPAAAPVTAKAATPEDFKNKKIQPRDRLADPASEPNYSLAP